MQITGMNKTSKEMKTSYRRLAVLLAALLLAMSLAPAAFADTSYTGPIDPETNEPVSESRSGGSSQTALSDSMFYDWTTHDFAYPVSGSLTEVHASVADGMYSSTPVSVSGGGDSGVAIFKDGAQYTGDPTNIREVGEYLVSYRQGGGTKRLLSFTIIGSTTSAIHEFVVPDGFYITSALKDEQDVYQDRFTLDMEEEGHYVVTYEGLSVDVVYTLDVVIDRTPPMLTFEGRIDSRQRVHSALSFSGLEEGDYIYLLQDGTQVKPELNGDGTGQILDPGNYIMRVYDAADNMKEYTFTIMVYFNTTSWVFFLAVIAVIVAVIAYVIIKRKRLKIG